MFIACDIGGTKFRVAKSADLVNFDEPIIKETPNDPKLGLELITNTIKELLGDEDLEGATFGIAGVLNKEHSLLLRSFHLPNWVGIDIKKHFEKEFGGKIYIENDSDIVGLGEAVAGAGRGFEIVVYITVSTGIGGTKIVNGKFEKNRFGFEPGYQILNNETKANWEDLSSGTSVENKYSMHPHEVSKTTDWDKIEEDVAVGIHNSILHWSPDVLVLGGSMARDFNAENIKRHLKKIMKIHPELPEIKIAELNSTGGIHGGFAYLRQRHQN